MSKIALDLKQFKHVKSDENFTTLKHKGGHTLTIAHKALGPDFKKQLGALSKAEDPEKMAEGGRVPIPADSRDQKPEKDNKEKPLRSGWDREGGAQGIMQNVKDEFASLFGKAEGGEVQKYAEGEQVQPEQKPEEQSVAKRVGEFLGNAGAQVASGMIDPYRAVAEIAKQAAPVIGNLASGVGQGIEKATGVSLTPPAEQPAQQPVEAPQAMPVAQQPQAPAAPVNPDPYGSNAQIEGLQKGIDTQQLGLQQQAQGQIQAASDKAKADLAYAASLQQQQDQFNDMFKQNMQNVGNTIKDIQNSHINPKAYMENLSSGQKIAAAIGLALGGFLHGSTGRANPMADFINKQIDRDIAAQAKAIDNKSTLLHAYQDQFKDNQAAQMMARATLAGKYAADISMAANNAANPIIKGQMLQESGKLQMQAAELVKKATMNKALSDAQGKSAQNPASIPGYLNVLDQVDPAKGKEMRARFIPGVGFANTAEDAKYLKEVEDRRKSISKNVKEVVELVKKKGTYEMLGPHNADLNMRIDQIATDMAKLQDPESIARPGEVELVKNTLLNPGLSTANKTAIDQVKNFNNTVQQRANQAYNIRGVKPPDPLQSLPPEQQEYAKWALQNPNNPKAKLVLEKLGLGN